MLAGDGQGLGCANTGHNVFALSVDQILAVIGVFSIGGITGKGDPGGAIFPHISKYHGLDIDRRSPFFRNVVQHTISFGAPIHP